jgi:glycosyltransferase involved in cell wall biosynthesis
VSTAKKVLDVMPYAYLPYKSGGQKSIAQFLDYLGQEVALSVITVEGNAEELVTNYSLHSLLGNGASRYYNIRLIKKITKFVKQHHIECIIWEHPYYAWLAFAIKKRTGVKTIFHTHNIEYLRFKSLRKWWWPILKKYETWAFKKADGVFFISPEEKHYCINTMSLPASKCFDVPFGVPINAYPNDKKLCREKLVATHSIAVDEKILLFNGALDYKPNTDAIEFIIHHINPLLLQTKLKYKIVICGKGLPPSFDHLKAYADKNIIYTGFVDDIECYFKGADLFLNPVQSGGGIKTKMVEAIAYGTKVVATASGAAGIVKEVCGDKLHVSADSDWPTFVHHILSAIEISSTTPQAYYNYYYWGAIATNVNAILQR